MAPPPPVPNDHSIAPEDFVYRRVKDSGNINVVNDKDGNRIASSAAFEDDDDGISVFLHSTLVEANLDAASVIVGFNGYVLAKITVEAIRNLGVGVVRDPNPADVKPMPCNIAHCLLKVPPLSKSQKHKVRQGLAHLSKLVG